MYKHGMWTQNAAVICADCSSDNVTELKDGNAVTFCDKCRAEIQLDKGVAHEHNLAASLKSLGFDAYMEQTGGMCSACCIDFDGDGEVAYLLITYNINNDDMYLLEPYNNEGDVIDTDWNYIEFESESGLIDWLLANKDMFA